MKKAISVFLALLLTVLMLIPAVAADTEYVLAENGTSRYRIVISENAPGVERNAAEILADYLEKITSAEFVTVTDSTPAIKNEIVVGVTNRDGEIDIDRSSFGQDGVRILTENGKLFLTGGEERGTIYSVFTFLEDYLGCRWFTEELTVIPKTDRLAIPSIDYSYVPCFRLRQTYWMFSTVYEDYCVEHKLHSYMAYISDDWGGSPSEYCVNSVHTLQWIIRVDMFEEHPEYFGCDENGNRSVNRQPCLSNEDVLRLVVDYAKNFCSQYNVIFSVSQNDGMSFCQCEKCQSFNKAHGNTDSASMINFVNRVAAAVREEYPDARFETLAYQDTLTPPANLEVAEGVVIRMCPINGCVLHDFDDPSCHENKKFDTALKGWAKLTDSIYMWNYSTNFQHYYALFPNITSLQARYRYFRDNNVVAVFDNGCGENTVAGEFHELRTYLVAKLMWNPDTDFERHIKEFCDAYYGEAADDVIEFIYTFEEDVEGYKAFQFSNAHITCQDGGESLENHTALTELEIKQLDRISEKALSRNLTAEQAHRLEGVSIAYRLFKCGTAAGEFNWLSIRNNPEEEAKKLCADMKAYGIKFLTEGEGTPLGEGEPNGKVPPTWWYAEESEIPQFIRIKAKILPFFNKVLRTLFWFVR